MSVASQLKSSSEFSPIETGSFGEMGRQSCLSANLIGAPRQSPVGQDEMAGVTVRISLEVILMLGFGLPELARRNDFGHSLAGPQAGSIDVGDRVFSNPLLLVARVKNRGSIAGPDVIALAIACAWVVNLEEELKDLSIAKAGRI